MVKLNLEIFWRNIKTAFQKSILSPPLTTPSLSTAGMVSSVSAPTMNVPREVTVRSAVVWGTATVGSAGVMRPSMGSLKLLLQRERRVIVN